MWVPVFGQVTLCGLGAGAMGAAVGNPADLAMVRMQADGRLPAELRRNYKAGPPTRPGHTRSRVYEGAPGFCLSPRIHSFPCHSS